jgi:hypothetical protein
MRGRGRAQRWVTKPSIEKRTTDSNTERRTPFNLNHGERRRDRGSPTGSRFYSRAGATTRDRANPEPTNANPEQKSHRTLGIGDSRNLLRFLVSACYGGLLGPASSSLDGQETPPPAVQSRKPNLKISCFFGFRMLRWPFGTRQRPTGGPRKLTMPCGILKLQTFTNFAFRMLRWPFGTRQRPPGGSRKPTVPCGNLKLSTFIGFWFPHATVAF